MHYGTLFTCPHCAYVYFIDWDGKPEVAQHDPEPLEETLAKPPPEATPSASTEIAPSAFNDFNAPLTEEPSFDASPTFEASPSFETAPEPSFEPTPEQEQVSESLAEVPFNPEPSTYDFSQPMEPVQESVVTPDTADFSDVTDFANSNAGLGPLSYTLIIEGIESSRLMMLLKEAMTDGRFGWDAAELLSKAKGGRLVLTRLNPAKASVLINRIKYMPFKISWRQDVLSGS